MAKNSKGGLGRGLDSLLGGYEAAMEPSRPAPASRPVKPTANEEPSNPSEPFNSPSNSMLAHSVAPSRTTEREVIREEDLPQEDRAVIDVEKKTSSSAAGSTYSDTIKPRTAVKDVVAKTEYIEENDGVTIVGVVERAPKEPSIAASSITTPTESNASAHNVLRSNIGGDGHKNEGSDNEADSAEHRMTDEVSIELVHPNPDQPRMHFNKEELEELSASIKKDGLLQPILVREADDGYEIIAGERRWQACKLAGMEKVPVRIKEADDMKVLELALIENLQRSDLNPIEEAYGYKRMMERSGRTQSEVAAAVSKGRSTIANALRLLDLPEEAQQLLYEERITAGHARAILSIPTEEGRQKLTEKLKNEKLSVREAESIARLFAGRAKAASQPPRPPMPKIYKTTAKTLTAQLGTKVRIRSANGKNKIEIEFKDEDDLQRLLEKMHEADQSEE